MKIGIIATLLAATLALASCNDPNSPGPQPDEDCELEKKKISMVEPMPNFIHQAGAVVVARPAIVSRPVITSRSTSRSSSRSWSSRSKSSTYRSKPSVKVPYAAPTGYRWVWDCD